MIIIRDVLFLLRGVRPVQQKGTRVTSETHRVSFDLRSSSRCLRGSHESTAISVLNDTRVDFTWFITNRVSSI